MMRTIMILLMLVGCTFERDVPGYGTAECIGLGETPDPRLVYEVEGWNLFWGILFSEMLLIPPLVVVTSAWSCPRRLAATKSGGA